MKVIIKTHQIVIEFFKGIVDNKEIICTKTIEYEDKPDKPTQLDVINSLNKIIKNNPKLSNLSVKAKIEEIYTVKKCV